MQGFELDLRFCDGKLDCFFCWSASPYLPLDPFLSREGPRSSKKGAAATGPLFHPWAAEFIQKGALQLDINVVSISASAFFLGRRESALLLCKRIPLQIVYAWAASVALLQCKGLNLTSASVMGIWTASVADRLLLIYRWTPFWAVSGRDPPRRGAANGTSNELPFGSFQWLCHA